MHYGPLAEGRTERLAELCRRAGGTHYLSGPLARDYIEPQVFEAMGITLSYFDYSGYPEYPQRFGAFEHGVTVLDLLFNVGSAAPRYMNLRVSALDEISRYYSQVAIVEPGIPRLRECSTNICTKSRSTRT